jgi:hypothetical protein
MKNKPLGSGLLTKLQRITRTVEYYVGFDKRSDKWKVMYKNGMILGSKFNEKKNAIEFAKMAAEKHYRNLQKNKHFTIDSFHESDIIEDVAMFSTEEVEFADDQDFGGFYGDK